MSEVTRNAESRGCTCTPGSEENGWHEDRCEVCLEAERQVWRDMFARMREEGIIR